MPAQVQIGSFVAADAQLSFSRFRLRHALPSRAALFTLSILWTRAEAERPACEPGSARPAAL